MNEPGLVTCVKPHIRLHCRRYFHGLIWRAQVGPLTDAAIWNSALWFATPRAALKHVDLRQQRMPLMYDPRDFMSAKPYIPKQ